MGCKIGHCCLPKAVGRTASNASSQVFHRKTVTQWKAKQNIPRAAANSPIPPEPARGCAAAARSGKGCEAEQCPQARTANYPCPHTGDNNPLTQGTGNGWAPAKQPCAPEPRQRCQSGDTSNRRHSPTSVGKYVPSPHRCFPAQPSPPPPGSPHRGTSTQQLPRHPEGRGYGCGHPARCSVPPGHGHHRAKGHPRPRRQRPARRGVERRGRRRGI